MPPGVKKMPLPAGSRRLRLYFGVMSDPFLDESRRLAHLLGVLVRTSGRSLRSLEKDLGLGSAGLSKVLNGTVRLQVEHVLRITEALGVDPGDFFRWAFPYRGRPGRLIQEASAAQGRMAEEPEGAADEVPADFDEQVKKALLRLLGAGA